MTMKKTLQKSFVMLVFAIIYLVGLGTSLQAQEIILGTGTNQSGTTEPSPANVYYESRRIQFVYTKSEINTAGVSGSKLLNSISFWVSGIASSSHSNYKIRIGHTTATNAASHISTTLTEVYSATSVSFNAIGWKTFTFTTPFTWNGLDNIVVDICWGVNSTYSTTGQVDVYTPDATDGIRTKNNITLVSCDDVTDTKYNKKPQAKLVFSALSPANDACANAQLLTVYGSSCGGSTLGDVSGATLSKAAICAGTADDDVWYKFVALSTSHTITVVGSSGFDAVIELMSGACMGTNVACADNTVSGGTETLTATGLTVGSTYLIRVYDYWSTAPTTKTFTICITTPAPANDNCSAATTLTVNSGTSCANATTGNIAGATASGVAITCGGSTAGGNDVWYKFVATSTSHIITVVGSGTSLAGMDPVIDLRSGSCSSSTNIACADATFKGGTEVINATGLTIGSTYYVRVYDWWYGSLPATTTFTICVTTPGTSCTTPGVPTNIVVTPTQTGASFTWGAPTNPAGSPTVVYYWMISTSATPVWSNYIARCGGSNGMTANTLGTGLGTCDAPAGIPATLTPNTQYYLHMYTRTSCDWSQSAWATTPFTTLPLGPANDECANAVTLTPFGNTCTTATTGDVANATQSKVAFCAGTANDDVWYKFTATATSHIITVVGSTSFDAVIELMSGACPGTNVSCADATNAGGTEVINATGLTVGNVYYVRVYDYYSSVPSTTTFTICITTPSTGVAPVANFTANTTTITVGGSVDFTDLSSGTPTSWAWQFAVGQPAGTCTPATSSLQNKTVVYNTAGTYTVKLTATNSYGNDVEEKIGYITVNPLTATLTATTTANPTTVCAGVQTQLNAVPNGGTGSYTYAWSSNPAGFTSTTQNPTVSPTTTTTYTVVVTSGSETANSNVVVTVNPLPNPATTITGSANVCKGQQGVSFYIPQIAGVTGYNWTLPTGATIGSGSNTNSIVVNFSANATSGAITVAGVNACGNGTASPSFSVTVNNPPVANAGNNQTIASGATANLTGSASGGSGSYSYSWEPSNLLVNANIQNPTTTALTSTTTFTLMVTDNTSGCQAYATVQVFTTGGSLSATATASPATICQGTQSTLQALPSGGTGSYTYSWTSTPAGFTSSLQNPVVSPTVTTTYNLTVNSSVNTTVIVTVNPLPSTPGSITGTPTVCQGAQQISYSFANVTNATGYIWTLTPGAAISAGVNTNSILVDFAPTATSGNISVVATNSCGTSAPSPNYMVTVNSLPAPAGNISGPQVVNSGQSGVTYFVPVINYATNYIWTLPPGVNIVSGANTNSIVVNFTSSATTGVIIVYGSNSCGSGASSAAFPVTILTGVEEVEAFSVALYPNPTNGLLIVEMNSVPTENFNLKVYNAIGELVYNKQMTTELKQTFDFNHFANGLYYINITGNKVNKIEKLIIQK